MLVLRLLVVVSFIICLMDGHAEVNSSATGIINGGEEGSVDRTDKKVDIHKLDRKKKKKPSKKKKKPKPSKLVTKAPAKITSTPKTKTSTVTLTQTSSEATTTTTTTTGKSTTTKTTARSTTITTKTSTVTTTSSTSTTTTSAANSAASGGECKTTGGKPCVFPFKDGENKEYNVCKDEGGRYFWCATKVNDAGKFIYWSYCPKNDPSCPLEVQITTPSGGCKATNNEPCIFPFKDGKKEYTECADFGGSYHWCATKTNSAGQFTSWATCPTDGSCPLQGQINISTTLTSTQSTMTSTFPYNETATNAIMDVEKKLSEIKESLQSMDTVEFNQDEKELQEVMTELTEYFETGSLTRENTHYDPMEIHNLGKKLKLPKQTTPGFSFAFNSQESSCLESAEKAKLTEAINTPEWMAFEGGKIPVPPEDLEFEVLDTYSGDPNSDLIKLLDGGCHSTHSITKYGIKFLQSKITVDLYKKILVEAEKVLSEKDGWICGIPKMLLLIKDKNTRMELMKHFPFYLETVDADLPENKIILGNGTPSYSHLKQKIILSELEIENASPPENKIINGKDVEPGTIPWQGLLLRQWPSFDENVVDNEQWDAYCGCVLIHSCYVLTARHCTFQIKNTDQVRIILGDVKVPDLSKYTPGNYKGPGQEREVMYIHHYPDPIGTPFAKQVDLTLILLKSSSSVEESSSMIIKPIKLADTNFKIIEYPPHNEATVSGFGQTNSINPIDSNKDEKRSEILQSAKVKIPLLERCKAFYQMMGFLFEVQDHNICAGQKYPYTGICHGDSGGPITVIDPETGEHILVGIASLGKQGCPTWMVYGVGVDVRYKDINYWINQILPTEVPDGEMGKTAKDGKPCACLRNALSHNLLETPAKHFQDINKRHCFIRPIDIDMYESNCGQSSNFPAFSIPVPTGGTTNGFTDWSLNLKFSDIICWEKISGMPIFKENCKKQINSNYPYGKMYLQPFDPSDCPTQLYSVPEYTHAYVLTGSNTKTEEIKKTYNYAYGKQTFTKDYKLSLTPECFSSLSMVTLFNGKKVSVSQIKIGDILQTVDENGKLINSPFLGWLHKDQHVKSYFLNIVTENQLLVNLSPLHLILVTESLNKKPAMKFANSVCMGDYLVSPHSKSLLRVISITQSIETGIYAPLTETGTILIDGLVASCYAHIASHDIAHLAMLPVRLMPGLLEDKESEHQDGIRTYAKYLMELAKPFLIHQREENIIRKMSLSTIATLILD